MKYEKSNALIIAESLSDEIVKSEEYINYMSCLKELKQDMDLYNRVNELRVQHFDIQNGGEGRMSYEEYAVFSAKSKELRKNALVSRFLDAEIGLGKLVKDVNRIIFSKMEFDNDFLN